MNKGRSFRFTHAVLRAPADSCIDGISTQSGPPLDVERFREQHGAYCEALKAAGVRTEVLPPLESYPDSVFVEDAALCFDGRAVVLRPGAPSRAGEAAEIAPHLESLMPDHVSFIDRGHVDGGDILLADDDAFIGLSARTNGDGVEALRPALESSGYTVRVARTPDGVLHFKSDCALLDERTIFATPALAAAGWFGQGYEIIETPAGESAAANLIRVNDHVILRDGFPRTRELLESRGYRVIVVDVGEAARLDGGLSCISLRFSLD